MTAFEEGTKSVIVILIDVLPNKRHSQDLGGGQFGDFIFKICII